MHQPGTSAARRWGALCSLLGVALALGWAIVRAGPTVTPLLDSFLRASQSWPARPEDGSEAFVSDSPSGLLMARLLGLDEASGFLWMSVGVMLLSSSLWILWAWMNCAPEERWRAARLTALAPVIGVMAAWLGFYDPFTLLAWGLVMFAWMSGSRALLAVAGLLLGFQHFEHGALGLVALTLAWTAVRTHLRGAIAQVSPLWAAIGLLIGKGALLLTLVMSGETLTGRTSWLALYVTDWSKVALNSLPTLLWALFAGSWAVVLAYWLADRGRRSRLLLAGALSVGMLATVISGDRPRVFIIVVAPALLVLTVAYLSRGSTQRRERLLVESVVWLAPTVTLWGAQVVYANVIDQALTTWGLLTG